MRLLKTSYVLMALTTVVLGAIISPAFGAPFCFVTSLGDDMVLKLDVALGRPGWQGPAVNITDPWDVTFGPDGNLYISSLAEDKIVKYDFASATVSDYLSIGDPMDIIFQDGTMFVHSNLNDDDKIYKRNTDGTLDLYAAMAGGREFGFGPDRNGDGASDLYWLGWGPEGAGIYYFTGQGDPGAKFDSGAPDGSYPYAMAWGADVVGSDGIFDLYVGDLGRDCISIYNGATGAYVSDLSVPGAGGMGTPTDMAIVGDRIYVADQGGDPWWGAVRVYDLATGEHIENIEGLSAPAGIAFEPAPQSVGSLQGNVVLEDYVGSKKLAPVQIDLIQGGITVFSKTVTLDSAGNYSIAGVPAGAFNVSFSACKWLRAVVADVTVPEGDAATCNVTLLNGDVDGSNEITTTDLSAVIKNLGP